MKKLIVILALGLMLGSCKKEEPVTVIQQPVQNDNILKVNINTESGYYILNSYFSLTTNIDFDTIYPNINYYLCDGTGTYMSTDTIIYTSQTSSTITTSEFQTYFGYQKDDLCAGSDYNGQMSVTIEYNDLNYTLPSNEYNVITVAKNGDTIYVYASSLDGTNAIEEKLW